MRHLYVCLVLLCALGVHAQERSQERAIDKEIVVPAPLAQVWESWTTKAGIEGFFAPEAEIDPRVDGAFHLHMDPYAEPGLKGADTMRYMALQPMKMLSFDWNAPPSLPEARKQRTFVVVRFYDVDGKSTRVTLHHVGWGEGGEWDRAYAYFNNVWGRVLGNLKTRYEFGPLDWSAWLAGLKASHAASAPAR
ncbi:SRPBCC family protein [Sphaerotilaceae bacterium SBD11-9]